MPPKRKVSVNGPADSNKAAKVDGHAKRYADHADLSEKHGIVLRDFYPPEISNERCKMYVDGTLPRPYDQLKTAIRETAHQRNEINVGEAVIHWFKRDLRLKDNKPLSQASQLAQKHGVPLVCLFVVSPEDYQAHLTSAARVDFELRTLAIMKEDLKGLRIPLMVDTVEKRRDVPHHLMSVCKKWKSNHVFCGIEYEVDELRREKKLLEDCLSDGIAFNPYDDDLVVAPGELSTGQGKQFSVYSPFYRAWIAHVHRRPFLLQCYNSPSENDEAALSRFENVFDNPIPSAPENKALSEEVRARLANIWPAGEHEAEERLDRFLREKIAQYKDTRNFPAANSTSMLSPHLAAGTLSARTAARKAREANTAEQLDKGIAGIVGWIGEVVWRSFYKHVIAHWPFCVMNKAFKPEYTDIEWEYNTEDFERWTKGMTGFPIVDAAMRQANYMSYIHNRCRMVVASFLSKDLMIDWRMGERWFMEHLIDGDFASNHGGWGFSSSTGVDPQPYFRVFNPLLQSERFDEKGEYIRHWVPELRELKGKEVHDPYGRGAGKTAEKNGYPRPMVDHKWARDRALARYKAGLGRKTA